MITRTCTIALLALLFCVAAGAQSKADSKKKTLSEIVKTDAGELVLVQTITIEAPVSDVWKAYTTSDGWMAWAAPKALVDLRAGGTIKTHYGPGAKIGDPGTNVLHIVNYVPERILTLRAALSDRWPAVMKEDNGKLMNVIVFESIDDKRTRVQSFGVGYRDLPAYEELMKFFVPANEELLRKLKKYLEK